MLRVLVTGATGNVGLEVIKSLSQIPEFQIFAGARDLKKAKDFLENFKVDIVEFDFEDPNSYKKCLYNCDILFLLRPPEISDTKKYIWPIIQESVVANIKHIIFLSVQGVEKNKFIPHHKIEKLIRESGLDYTFLRPAYFMQNFTTTLKEDICKNHKIFLPAGSSLFTLIDVSDIGRVTAKICENTSIHKNLAYELTSQDLLSFSQMAGILSHELKREIRYESPNLPRFILEKRRQGMPFMLTLVMIMLHYLPRFQKPPATTDLVEKLSGSRPVTFEGFVRRNLDNLKTSKG